jgi:phosphoribosyl 1,2-cyclic phosphate phosphodiesterase
MKITILGCGASSGSPLIGEEMPANPKNIRTRASIFIEGESTNILIDTSPDFRAQALAARIKKIDAVIYTHTHADHINGIDDIKSFAYRKKAPVPAYASRQSIDELTTRFSYCFIEKPTESGWIRPYMKPQLIEAYKEFEIGEFKITPFTQLHTKDMDSFGIRINDFVYSTDVKSFPPESEKYLRNLDLWIVDCLKADPSKTHSDINQTLSWIKKYQPKHSILTHLSYEVDYDILKTNLPPHIEPAYDGLVLSCS